MSTYVGGRVSEIISADDIMLLMIGVAQVLLGNLLDLVSKVTKLYEIATYISDILTSLINQSANVIPDTHPSINYINCYSNTPDRRFSAYNIRD